MNKKRTDTFSKLREEAGARKTVLHLACGVAKPDKLPTKFRGEDWFELRADADSKVNPALVTGIHNLSALPDQSIDAIWNAQGLDHLEAHDVPAALAEWFRVLKEGGEILVKLPDLAAVATHIAHGKLEEPLYQSTAGAITALDVVFGYGPDLAAGKRAAAHRTGFTAETLAKKLSHAGFCNVTIAVRELYVWAEARRLAASDPARVPRSHIVREPNATKPPPEPPIAAQRHPGALWKGQRTDELDVPPTPLDARK